MPNYGRLASEYKKRLGGYHYPGYKYLGPGTDLSRKRKPINALDRAARRHDYAYNRLSKRPGVNVYTQYSRADDRFLRDIRGYSGSAARVSRGIFRLKKLLAPKTPGYHRSHASGRPKRPGRNRSARFRKRQGKPKPFGRGRRTMK